MLERGLILLRKPMHTFSEEIRTFIPIHSMTFKQNFSANAFYVHLDVYLALPSQLSSFFKEQS